MNLGMDIVKMISFVMAQLVSGKEVVNKDHL